ncbi:MAG: Ca-activated chloride channel family protein [Pseudoalteromonas tetraodonis]|jgi:Ca-activated chloride channel family protein
MNIEMSKAEQEEARLTAYVLGELDADETKVVEALLEESAEARASLNEIEATAALLSAEFLKEPALSLRDEQVEAITSDREGESKKIVRGQFMPLLAVAACACLFAVVGMKQYLGGLESSETESLTSRADNATEESRPNFKTDRGGSKSALGLDSDTVSNEVIDQVRQMPQESFAAGGVASEPNGAPEIGASIPMAESAAKAPAPVDDEKSSMPRTVRSIEKKSASNAEPRAQADSAQIRPSAPITRSPRPKAKSMTKALAEGAVAPSKPAASSRGSDPTMAAGEPAERTLTLLKGRAGRGGQSRLVEENREAILPGARDKVGDGESYGELVDNPWVSTWNEGLSTFAIDVDTGTYPNVRRFLKRRASLPPRDAVRIEEMINYFDYDYAEPEGKVPFSVNMEVASCPWAKGHRLLRVGLRGKGVDVDKRPPSNLVFLIDVSGSMRGAEKLDLLKRSMKSMVAELNEDDRIGIVTYAGSSGVVLEPTHGDLKEKINQVLDGLQAGGSTNGASGIATAYSLAKANFVEGGTNRVILATDGDFNVGVTDRGDLVQMVEKRAGEQIFLTVLGVGEGNLQEHRMEQIADKGNGSYHYLDSEKEGQKVLVRGLGATLVTVAKDVMVQLDFNPAKVQKYRLLGYANRRVPNEAFHLDETDGGEIGAGHMVTALYEIVPVADGAEVAESPKDGSRYLQMGKLVASEETLTLKLNYKLPEGKTQQPTIVFPLIDPGKNWPEASEDFRFAASVAGFGMLLRGSDYAGLLNYDLVLELGAEGITEGGDSFGLRAEFLGMVKAAKSLNLKKE